MCSKTSEYKAAFPQAVEDRRSAPFAVRSAISVQNWLTSRTSDTPSARAPPGEPVAWISGDASQESELPIARSSATLLAIVQGKTSIQDMPGQRGVHDPVRFRTSAIAFSRLRV